MNKIHSSIQIMGILNCTPDSFYDGGDTSVSFLVEKALQMVEEGADIIDIGGESTRPGAESVSEQQELERVIGVIEGIRQHSSVTMSIDTTKSTVAYQACQAGASLINDVSGLRYDPEMAAVAAQTKAKLIIMHSRGTPESMQALTTYTNLIEDVISEIQTQIQVAVHAGVDRSQIWIDPGIGFAKTAEQNLTLIQNLQRFQELDYPLVMGLSRKSFIGAVTGQKDPADRLVGSLIANMVCVLKGASVLRVHDVSETRQAISMISACLTDTNCLKKENQ